MPGNFFEKRGLRLHVWSIARPAPRNRHRQTGREPSSPSAARPRSSVRSRPSSIDGTERTQFFNLRTTETSWRRVSNNSPPLLFRERSLARVRDTRRWGRNLAYCTRAATLGLYALGIDRWISCSPSISQRPAWGHSCGAKNASETRNSQTTHARFRFC